MRRFAWALVAAGLLMILIGGGTVIAWESRSFTDVNYDALLGRQLAAWAWPLVITGAFVTAFGILLLALRPPVRPPS